MWPVFCYEAMANHTTHSQRPLCWVLGWGTVGYCWSSNSLIVTIILPDRPLLSLTMLLATPSFLTDCKTNNSVVRAVRGFAKLCKNKRKLSSSFCSFTGRWDEEDWDAANPYDGQRQEGWSSPRPSETLTDVSLSIVTLYFTHASCRITNSWSQKRQ